MAKELNTGVGERVISGENSYRRGNNGGIPTDVDGFTEVTNRKRRRRSTGGTFEYKLNSDPHNTISKDKFRLLSTDEKLVTSFDMMSCVYDLNSRVQNAEQNIDKLMYKTVSNTTRIKTLEDKSIDAEARDRKINLIFRGIPEVFLNENCENLVIDFLKTLLGIGSAGLFYIQRAHRLGAPPKRNRNNLDAGQRPIPIIVCFRDYKDVEAILSQAYKLQGKPSYGINRDYPKEIVDARSRLWPEYKKQKSLNKKGSVFIGFPAKLIVNKKIVIDEFPDWKSVMATSRPTSNNKSDATDKNLNRIDETDIDLHMNTDKSSGNELSSDDSDSESVTSVRIDAYSHAMIQMETQQRDMTQRPPVPNRSPDQGASGGPADLHVPADTGQ